MATKGTDFWTELLTILEGDLTSSPSYYLPNSGDGINGAFAQEGEYGNVIQTIFSSTEVGSPERARVVDLMDEAGFWKPSDNLDFWKTDPLADDPAQYSSLQAAAEERMPDMFGDSDDSNLEGGVNTKGSGISTGTSDTATQGAEQQSETGIGGGGPDEATQLTILTGEEMTWSFDASTGKWYVEYGLPGSDRSVIFEADPSQMDALFGKDRRPTTFQKKTLKQLTVGTGTFAGNIAEMEGTGSFEAEVGRVTTLGLDGGVLPEWAAQDGAAMDILYIAQAEGKSKDWVIDQLSETAGFKARFPSINKIKSAGNLTTVEAITGFLEFEAGLRASVKSVGSSADIVTPAVVASALDKGHSLNTLTTAVGIYDRVQKYAPALEAFNGVLAEAGMDPISSLQDMFDFVNGAAPVEVYELWEASSVSEAAANAGLGDVFTAQDALAYADRTQGSTSLEDATGLFQSAAQMLLRFRTEIDMGQHNLDQDDIIDMAIGNPPRSGQPAAELQEGMNRAILSAQKRLAGRAKPFTAFTEGGTPQQQSLRGLRESQ